MKIVRAIHLPRRLAHLFTIVLSALLTFATGREVFAAVEWNHLWQYSSTFSVTTTSAGSMVTYMTNAKNNYDSATDLNVGASGPIAGYEGNYGMTYWQGLTQPFNSSSQSCIIWPTALSDGSHR